MSEENAPTPDRAAEAAAKPEPRVRRISNPRPTKKSARPAKAIKVSMKAHVPEKADSAEHPALPAEQPAKAVPVPFPVFDGPEESAGPASDVEGDAASPLPEDSDWPEPEPATSGESAVQEGGKRNKRRRKRGKGGGGSQAAPADTDSAPVENLQGLSPAPVTSPKPSQPPPRPPHAGQGGQPQPSQPSRPKHEPDAMAKLAWKIYLSEVSEEGVALIGDNDAKELARRCFRLAEIFLDEQTKRR
jgi:hypothetical protein